MYPYKELAYADQRLLAMPAYRHMSGNGVARSGRFVMIAEEDVERATFGPVAFGVGAAIGTVVFAWFARARCRSCGRAHPSIE
jgi:hypothetical protein